MTSPFQTAGGAPQKQPRYTTLFEDRMFTGLYTQRAVLHDPSDVYTARFYGGRPDVLLGGRNIELTNRLTLQRRPGMIAFGTNGGFSYPTPPDRAFSFQLSDGTIRVIIDTEDSGLLSVTSVANSSLGNAVYMGTFPGGGNNGYVGLQFTIKGFVTNTENNGVFTVTNSTTTTLTLNNAVAVAETATATAETAGGVYWDQQDGSAELLVAKTAGAGQMYFIAVAGVLYMGDGVQTYKYTPLNTNGTIWNWGIVAPTAQPTVTETPSGSASTVWQASTVFSTMGLTKDTNSTPQIWQLISVNPSAAVAPTNPQFLETGTGEPNWQTGLFSTTSDNGITWLNVGVLNDWAVSTFYGDLGTSGATAGNCAIAVASVNCIYGNFKNSGSLGKSESSPTSEPHFSGAWPGASYFEGNNQGFNGLNWFPLFNYAAGSSGLRWKQSHAYPGWFTGSPTGAAHQISGTVTCCITGDLPSTLLSPVYLMVPTGSGGTSGSGYAPFLASSAIGATVGDNQAIWMCMGQAAWQANYPYLAWTAQGNAFGVVYDGTNFQVCVKNTGLSGATAPGTGSNPAWATTYGSTTTDSSVTWVCVGPNVAWASAQTWNLPTAGFFPPYGSTAFGGSTVIGGGYVESVISSGTSGSTAPSWPAPPGTVSDGSVTWRGTGTPSANSLSWSYGLAYAYSYMARPTTDLYSPAPDGGGLTPPGWPAPLGAPTGSETYAVSSASPANQIVGANPGSVNTISGKYSDDPQVDTIIIWRSADSASGADNMYFLTEIPNIVGNGTWTFPDYLPSVATGTFPGLNILLPAPINDVNDPPASTYLPQVYNYQRIWGSNDEQVNFSGGPDTFVGNPNEAFNPSDELPFLAPVTRLVKTPQGIVTFLTDSIEMIGGGPATATFFSVTMAPGIGLLSYNACDVYAGEIYFFASDNQFRVMTPSLNLSNFGFPLGDQFANLPAYGTLDTTWDPTKVYVAVHQNGIDNCIFVADGSTGWYRLNPHQIPGAAQGPEPIWSPYAVITGGAKMVQSVETTPGIKQLLAGPTSPADNILARDLAVFTDDGDAYDAYFTMGSIKLAEPGQIALLKFIEFDFSGIQFQPTISYLMNEISGTFTEFINGQNVLGTTVPVFDPPALYGETIAPSSYSPNRYYFSANASLAKCRHMQVKVDFGGGTEVISTTIDDVQISSNVLTLTVASVTGFEAGQTVYMSGLTNATFLNGTSFVLTSVGSNTLVGNYTHANWPGLYTAEDSQSVTPGTDTVSLTLSISPAATSFMWYQGCWTGAFPSYNLVIPSGFTTAPSFSVSSAFVAAYQVGTAGTYTASTNTTFANNSGDASGFLFSFNTTGSSPVGTHIGDSGSEGNATLTSTAAVSAGAALIVYYFAQLFSGQTHTLPTTCTDSNGNTYELLGSQSTYDGSTYGSAVVAFICKSATANTGGHSVTYTLNGVSNNSIWSVCQFTNLSFPNSGADTGTAETTINVGGTTGDELYSMSIVGRNIVET